MRLKQFPHKDRFFELAGTSNVVPVCEEILADTHTPVSVLQKCYSQDRECFLLESAEGGEQWARYSFLGVRAHGAVRIFDKEVGITIAQETCTVPHNGDPLAALRTLTARFRPAQMPELPGFWCGLTGYATHEMVSFFEDIPGSLPPEVPLAHFIIPGEMIIFDNRRQTLICMKICYIEDGVDLDTLFNQARNDLEKMVDMVRKPAGDVPEPDPFPGAIRLTPDTRDRDYLAGVNTIKSNIREGEVFQAVLSRAFSFHHPVDPIRFYRAQRYVNPSPYLFFMNFIDFVLAGSSPETMVRLDNGSATLRPIAGTRPRGRNEQEDRNMADELLSDDKEKAEHVMLIDLGRHDLGRVAEPGTVQVTDTMFVERYSHVMHLVSNITCDLRQGLDAFDLFRSAFPAGTLTGAPKVSAMKIIAGLESSARWIYGGAAGYISFTGNMDFAIVIRTAVIHRHGLTVRAGAGIVHDSDPQKELAECRNKAKSVETALRVALGSHTGGE